MIERFVDRGNHFLDVLGRNDQGWRQQHDVARNPDHDTTFVGAALHGCSKGTFHRRLAVAVSDKLDRGHQTVPAAYISNEIVFVGERSQSLEELSSAGSRVDHDVLASRLLETGDCGGGADRMGGVGVTVPDVRPARSIAFEDIGDHPRHERGTEREIAGGDCLRDRHEIGTNSPMPRAAPVTCAPEAGDHFVRNQQDSVTFADFPDAWHEGRVRHDDSAGAENWLHDEGRDRLRPLERDFIFKRTRTVLRQPFGIGLIERVPVRVR